MAAGDPLRDSRYASIDISKPNVARVYDCMLGGKDNFAADREFVAEVLRFAPKAPLAAIANRHFLRRVMQYLVAEAGVTQFLDLGSGLPTQGNVSEVAHQHDPEAHIVHVDFDPIVYTHSKALLADARTTDFVLGDVRRPGEILADPVVRALIDFDRPVGIIASAILHHIVDEEDPLGIIRAFRDAVPAGSYLFISHFRTLGDPDSAALEEVMFETFGRGAWRTDAQIAQYFEGADLLAPGIVPCAQWRPEADPGELSLYQRLVVAGLARK